MEFINPKCYIFAGYNLTDEQLKKIREKEKFNQRIEFYTYNEILIRIENTLKKTKRNCKKR